MLCFFLSFIVTSQVALGIGSLSKVASVLLAPILARVSDFSLLVESSVWQLMLQLIGLIYL